MVVQRGEIWRANLNEPADSDPGNGRPVLVVQSDAFNHSCIHTMMVAAITSDLDLAAAPGNVALMGKNSGLVRDSVVDVAQVLTIDREFLTEFVGSVSAKQMARVDQGLRLALGL
jgi:mRNA interferase MazF